MDGQILLAIIRGQILLAIIQWIVTIIVGLIGILIAYDSVEAHNEKDCWEMVTTAATLLVGTVVSSVYLFGYQHFVMIPIQAFVISMGLLGVGGMIHCALEKDTHPSERDGLFVFAGLTLLVLGMFGFHMYQVIHTYQVIQTLT